MLFHLKNFINSNVGKFNFNFNFIYNLSLVKNYVLVYWKFLAIQDLCGLVNLSIVDEGKIDIVGKDFIHTIQKVWVQR
jgi:hypothetical protein